jgi:lipopolysaccharide biosynthesis regulator YciM
VFEHIDFLLELSQVWAAIFQPTKDSFKGGHVADGFSRAMPHQHKINVANCYCTLRPRLSQHNNKAACTWKRVMSCLPRESLLAHGNLGNEAAEVTSRQSTRQSSIQNEPAYKEYKHCQGQSR